MTRNARNSQVAEQAHLEGVGVQHAHGQHRQRQHGQLGAELAERVAEEQLAEVVVAEQPAAQPGRLRLGGGTPSRRPRRPAVRRSWEHPDPLIGNYQSVIRIGYRVAMDTADARRGDPLEPAPYGPLPVGSGRQVWARRPADEAEAKALASPLRLRILRVDAARAAHQQGDRRGAGAQPGLGAAPRAHARRHRLPDRAARTPRPARLAGAALPRLGQVLLRLDRRRADLAAARTCCSRRSSRRSTGCPPGQLDSARLGFRLSAEDRERVQAPAPGRCSTRSPRMPSDPEGEPWSLYLGLHPEARPAYRLAHDAGPRSLTSPPSPALGRAAPAGARQGPARR